MLDYLSLERFSYQSSNTDIKESFVNSSTLSAIKPPVIKREDGKFILDINHRFFLDDINYGICILKWFADQLNLKVPTIDVILRWAKNVRRESYTLNPALQIPTKDLSSFIYGIPPCYGISNINEAVQGVS